MRAASTFVTVTEGCSSEGLTIQYAVIEVQNRDDHHPALLSHVSYFFTCYRWRPILTLAAIFVL